MSTHRLCCCGPGTPTTCADTCDFASSYVVSQLTGSFSGTRIARGVVSNPCVLNACHVDQEEAGWYGCGAMFELSVTWSQPSAVTLSRSTVSGGACCYQANGYLDVEWSFKITERHACCVPSPDVVCDNEDTITGSMLVPFCLTVTCMLNAYGADDGWLHNLSICSFPMGNINIIEPSLCNPSTTCSTTTVGAMCAGMSWSWKTPIKALDALVSSDWTALGYCMPGKSCSSVVEGGTLGQDPCMQEVTMNTQYNGPFSVAAIDDYQTAPATCSLSASAQLCWQTGTIAGNAWRVNPWCDPSGDWDVSTDCWEWTFSTNIGIPSYA